MEGTTKVQVPRMWAGPRLLYCPLVSGFHTRTHTPTYFSPWPPTPQCPCSVLKVCVPSNSTCGNPTPQGDGY